MSRDRLSKPARRATPALRLRKTPRVERPCRSRPAWRQHSLSIGIPASWRARLATARKSRRVRQTVSFQPLFGQPEPATECWRSLANSDYSTKTKSLPVFPGAFRLLRRIWCFEDCQTRIFRLTEERKIAAHAWVHPDDDDRRQAVRTANAWENAGQVSARTNRRRD
jgi:hypothetical protein